MAKPRRLVRTPKVGLLARIAANWPLKKYLGVYAYLPVFFCMGAALEFAMINMNINNVNFYQVYSKKTSEKLAQQQLQFQSNIESLIEEEKKKLINQLKESQSIDKTEDKKV